MNQNLQSIVQETKEDNTSSDQSLLMSGTLLVINLFVMLFVGLYWMNPVMHEYISGRPLL